MARKISIAGTVVLLLVVAVFVAGDWGVFHHSAEEECGVCQRHIHPQAGVVAEIGGKRHHMCCAHCAMTEARQEQKPLRLIEVTDYTSGRTLDPEQAWFVDGSRIVACTHDMTRMNEMKQVEQLKFDRCSPGTFAFATRADAEAFSAKNGGSILDLKHMLAGVDAGEAKQ